MRFILKRELSNLFMFKITLKTVEQRKDTRAKSSISGTDLYPALQLSSYDPLSFIQQLYSDFVPTSSFITTLEKLFVKPVIEIVSVFSIKCIREQRGYNLVSSCTSVMDFSGHWSQHNLTEDQSLFLNIFIGCVSIKERSSAQ